MSHDPQTAYGVTFLAAGHEFVAPVHKGTVGVFRYQDGRLLREIGDTEATVTSVGVSSDEQYLAVGADDGSVSLFDFASGRRLWSHQVHRPAEVWGVQFSPDSRLLYTVSRDHTGAIWSVPDGQLLFREALHDDEINGLAISPDGALIATGSDDLTVRLWDRTFSPLAILRAHETMVLRVAFLDNGRYLVSSSGGGAVVLWDVGGARRMAAFTDHAEEPRWREVWALAATPHGNYAAYGGTNGLLIVRHLPSGRELARFYPEGVPLYSVSIDEATGHLVAGANRGHVVGWALGKPGSKRVLVRARSGRESPDAGVYPDGRVRSGDPRPREDNYGVWPERGAMASRVVMPSCPADKVHFSVTSPNEVSPGTVFVIDVWAHMASQRQAVIDRAREEAAGHDIRAKTKGPVHLARGTVLSVRLSLEGLRVEDPMDVILWEGEIGNATFSVEVPEDAREGPRRGLASVHLDGLRIAKVHFLVDVGRSTARADTLPAQEDRHVKAFASYASGDRDQVLARLQGILKAAPHMDVFLDVLCLRAGQHWAQELSKTIHESDVFYLFWSENARRSEWVEKEWRCALESRGIDFIDPVPLVSPELVPPPPELASRHFGDWTLAFMSVTRHTET